MLQKRDRDPFEIVPARDRDGHRSGAVANHDQLISGIRIQPLRDERIKLRGTSAGMADVYGTRNQIVKIEGGERFFTEVWALLQKLVFDEKWLQKMAENRDSEKSKSLFFDFCNRALLGNSNAGHDKYGTDMLTEEQRWQLVEYLKTL